MRTTMTSLVALALFATPAAAWFAPNRYSGLPFWAEVPVPVPQWFAWTANWATVDKWVTTMWPDAPRSVAERARVRLMPPTEYDQPYSGSGDLRVTDAVSQDEVRGLCVGAAWPKVGALGCSMKKVWGCHVVLAPEADLKRVGLTRGLTLRHEIAHCNGWPGDHRGALPIEDWALMDLPEAATNLHAQPSTSHQPASRRCGLAIQKPCE
jgi:hypothetical protein